MPSRSVLLDDRALVAVMVGERLPIRQNAERFTTSYFYYRACRAAVIGAGGHLSGPFEKLDLEHRRAAVDHLLTLPHDVHLPDPRALLPEMVAINRRHPQVNLLNTEAAAAALLLGAKMVLSHPTATGQLAEVLQAERIAYQTVDLP